MTWQPVVGGRFRVRSWVMLAFSMAFESPQAWFPAVFVLSFAGSALLLGRVEGAFALGVVAGLVWVGAAAFEGHDLAVNREIAAKVSAKYDVTVLPNTDLGEARSTNVDVLAVLDGRRVPCQLRLLKGDDPVVYCGGLREADHVAR